MGRSLSGEYEKLRSSVFSFLDYSVPAMAAGGDLIEIYTEEIDDNLTRLDGAAHE